MRVLIWSDLFWPYLGGIEVLLASLLPDLRNEGFLFEVLTSHFNRELPDHEIFRGLPLHRLPFRRFVEMGDVTALRDCRQGARDVVASFQPDLVHVHGIGPSSVFVNAAVKDGRAPLIVTLHQQLLRSQLHHDGAVLHQLLRRADWVTTVSEFVMEEVRARHPALASRSSVIDNFVELPMVEPRPISCADPVLLCLGRLVTQKGFDIAIKAFPEIRARHPGARLVVAGDGDRRRELEQLADNLGLGHSIAFHGWVAPTYVPALIDQATLVLMPSRWEGFGIVAIEAAWLGRPVVAARAGGIRDVVLDGETGTLVEPDNVAAFAGATLALLHSPEQATRMGRAAMKRARERYSRPRVTQAYRRLYEQMGHATLQPRRLQDA